MDNHTEFSDRQYMYIVKDILSNEEFNKLSNIIHHGLDRKSHSVRVSYYSYKISKLLGFDYISTARAGLLHDFFFENNKESNLNTKIKTLVNHPKYALKNASEEFTLNEIEKDIIVSHMFPISLKPSKYVEGWVVNFVDDAVALSEICYKTRNKLAYAMNFMLILLFTYFK